jgi:primosomal protein N' (replication factor Y)
MFAEVAVPVYVHQTFTYALPASFAASAQPGCRVLVPFNKQLLTGYIVSLYASLEEAGQSSDGYEVKEVEELFDTDPLVTSELLELTKWIADYYFAPWGEVIKCCLPAGINAEAETIVSITTEGRAALTASLAKRAQASTKMQGLALIAENGMLAARDLAKQFNNRQTADAGCGG